MSTATATHWTEALRRRDACKDAVAWCEQHDSFAAAWAACERGDWMMWLLGELSGPPESDSRKKLVMCACACARLALRHVPCGDERPRRAIEVAEAYCRGEATLDDVRAAAYAAYAYAPAGVAAAAYAAHAAYNSAYAAAADAGGAANNSAYAAAGGAYAAGAAYAATAAAAAADQIHGECADIVRRHYPTAPELEIGDG